MSDFSVKRRISPEYIVYEGDREKSVYCHPDNIEETVFLKKGTPVEFFDKLAHSRVDWNTETPDVGIVLGLSVCESRSALKILRLPDRREFGCVYFFHIRPISAERRCDITKCIFSVGDYAVVTGELPDGIKATLGSASALEWNTTKANAVGRKFQVHRLFNDGDISLRGVDEFWPPEYLRKATQIEIDDDERPFFVGNLVVCETEHDKDGMPGWNPQMTKTVGLIGTVVWTRDGLYGVKYQNYPDSYAYRDGWLRPATSDEKLVFDRLKTACDGLSNEQQELALKSNIVDSVFIGKRRRV